MGHFGQVPFRPEQTWTFRPKNIDVSAKKMDVSAKIYLIVLQKLILFVGGFTE